MKTLFDYDHVEVVALKDAKAEYPNLNWKRIEERFVWDINGHEVMAVDDLLIVAELGKRNISIDDVNYLDIAVCSVCRKVLLPDDECYSDAKTGDPICDEHSVFSDVDNNYHKVIF